MAFLVARDQEGQRARVIRISLNEFGRSIRHRSQCCLHVGSAAPAQFIADDFRLEGVGIPFFFRARRHHIGMPGETQ